MLGDEQVEASGARATPDIEWEAREKPLGQVRCLRGGRTRVADLEPRLRPTLLALVEPRGDPGNMAGQAPGPSVVRAGTPSAG
ncbi:hypothetical protein DY245_27920 [Streptomyces inhibens]|uniref:Uncharacterized protein n=1 Tax=Streptomyces inhibens TaxID=2293571 RepID=A0A371PXM5_STRIH|nr:hypothetical protein DY245_27920 [Streptomyces inhibens]